MPKGTKAIFFILLVLCVVVFISANRSYIKNQELDKKEKKIKQLIQEELERTDYIEEQRIYYNSKEYVEELAREKLGLIMPNEILILPEEDN